jgi:hypothetical protein
MVFFLLTLCFKKGAHNPVVHYFLNSDVLLDSKKLLEVPGLADQSYTLYGYRHTGAINLCTATKDLLPVQYNQGIHSLSESCYL